MPVELVTYPFHLFPEIGFPKGDGSGKDARKLTEEEKTLLQSSLAWMQACDAKIPRMTTASYSELYFVVAKLGHMQCNVKAVSSSHLSDWVALYKARYVEATGQKQHGFYEILNYDFSLLEEVLFNCAEFEADGNCAEFEADGN
jgi:hypothetical protein